MQEAISYIKEYINHYNIYKDLVVSCVGEGVNKDIFENISNFRFLCYRAGEKCLALEYYKLPYKVSNSIVAKQQLATFCAGNIDIIYKEENKEIFDLLKNDSELNLYYLLKIFLPFEIYDDRLINEIIELAETHCNIFEGRAIIAFKKWQNGNINEARTDYHKLIIEAENFDYQVIILSLIGKAAEEGNSADDVAIDLLGSFFNHHPHMKEIWGIKKLVTHIYIMNHKLPEAEKSILEMAELIKNNGNTLEETFFLNKMKCNIAKIYWEEKNFSKAQEHLANVDFLFLHKQNLQTIVSYEDMILYISIKEQKPEILGKYLVNIPEENYLQIYNKLKSEYDICLSSYIYDIIIPEVGESRLKDPNDFELNGQNYSIYEISCIKNYYAVFPGNLSSDLLNKCILAINVKNPTKGNVPIKSLGHDSLCEIIYDTLSADNNSPSYIHMFGCDYKIIKMEEHFILFKPFTNEKIAKLEIREKLLEGAEE